MAAMNSLGRPRAFIGNWKSNQPAWRRRHILDARTTVTIGNFDRTWCDELQWLDILNKEPVDRDAARRDGAPEDT
jgi:hypothetical protein